MERLGQNQNEASQCCCPTPFFNSSAASPNINKGTKIRNSSSECRHNFVATTSSSIFPNTDFTNHESLPSLQESFNEFNKVYPQYSDTELVDHVRAEEYHHLSNHTCLDYIGVGLFSHSQLQQHRYHGDASKSQLASTSTSNQYPEIPFFSLSCKTGNLKTLLIHGGQESEFESAMRKRIMNFLNISETDYYMVFTANRTSAFKLVADSYQFQSSRKLLTVYDYESEAVENMISASEKRGARAISAEFSWPRFRIQTTKLRKIIVGKRKNKKKKKGLFVFPLHSRVTGTRYPYLWMSVAQENGWHVLVDACALGPKDMDSFGLSLFLPDFLICSFYKVYGENPSGFGCLFVKKSTISSMEATSSAGIVNLVPQNQIHLSEDSSGTDLELEQKTISSIQEQGEEEEEEELSSMRSFAGPRQATESGKDEEEAQSHRSFEIEEANQNRKVLDSLKKKKSVAQGSENGGFEIECRGLDQVDSLGSILISTRARFLINWLVNSMVKLKHPHTEEFPLVKIYGPRVKFDRGAALAFNVFDWKGEKVEPVLVQKLADRSNISIGYGFLHHIWFADKYAEDKGRVLQSKKEVKGNNNNKKKKDRDNEVGVSVVTAALGFLASFEDVYRLWAFVARFLDADFVEKERWRYTALNQKTIEV